MGDGTEPEAPALGATEPTAQDIAKFMKCFDILSRFEAEHRLLRGWGAAFDQTEFQMPDPAVMAVSSWLREIANA